VQLLVDNRSDSTKMHGTTIRFIGYFRLKGKIDGRKEKKKKKLRINFRGFFEESVLFFIPFVATVLSKYQVSDTSSIFVTK